MGGLQTVEPLVQRGQEAALVGIERAGEPLARAHDVADQFGLFGPRRLEQHRARIAVEMGRHVDQIDRLLAHLAFAEIDELVDEVAQPEALGIDCRHGRPPIGAYDRGSLGSDLAMRCAKV